MITGAPSPADPWIALLRDHAAALLLEAWPLRGGVPRALDHGLAGVHALAADAVGRRLAFAVQPPDGLAAVVLIDAATGAIEALPAPGPGPWALSRPVLSPDGRRLAVAARPAALPLAELYVYALDGSDGPRIIAGIALDGAHGAEAPRFVPDTDTLVFLRGSAGGFELALLDLARPGASAEGIRGVAPGRREFAITQGLQADPAVAPAWCAPLRRLLCVQPAPGDRWQIIAAGPGQSPQAAGVAHDRILSVAAAAEGTAVAWVADEGLWWADGARLEGARRVPGPAATGPLAPAGEGFVYATADGLAWARGPAEATPVCPVPGAIRALLALPADPRALARIKALGLAPPDGRSDAAVAARRDLPGWLAALPSRPDGLEALALLDELADDGRVARWVAEHLATEIRRRALDGAAATAHRLLFALSAAARLKVGQACLRDLCAEAAPQVREQGDVDPPVWLALEILEGLTAGRAVDPQAALAAHARWRGARRAALESEDAAAVAALCEALAGRLSVAGEGAEAPRLGAERPEPGDEALAARFTADRAAVEAALEDRERAEAARAAKAASAREQAEREAARRAEEATRAQAVAEARARAEAARAAAQAREAAAQAAAAAEAETARREAARDTVAALAAESTRRGEADKIAAAARRIPAAAAPEGDLLATVQAANVELTAALARARRELEATDELRARAAAEATRAKEAQALAETRRAEAETELSRALIASEAALAAQAAAETARAAAETARMEREVSAARALAEAEMGRIALEARLREEAAALRAATERHTVERADLQARLDQARLDPARLDPARLDQGQAQHREAPAELLPVPPAGRIAPAVAAAVLAGGGAAGICLAWGAPLGAAAGAAAVAALAGLLGGRR